MGWCSSSTIGGKVPGLDYSTWIGDLVSKLYLVQSPNLGYGTWISGTVPGFSNVLGLGVQYPNLRFGTWIRGTILGLGVPYLD